MHRSSKTAAPLFRDYCTDPDEIFAPFRRNLHNRAQWKCKCTVCGTESIHDSHSLRDIERRGGNGCKHVKEIHVGDRFGKLTVLKRVEDYVRPNGYKETQYLCECDCGNQRIVKGYELTNGKISSCYKCAWLRNGGALVGNVYGTLKVKQYLGESKYLVECQKCGRENIVNEGNLKKVEANHTDGCWHYTPIKAGERFGKLTAIKPVDDEISKDGSRYRRWLCNCDCGKQAIVREVNLRNGNSKSCGKCGNRVSHPEKAIAYYTGKLFLDIQENYRPDFLNGLEIDIFIPDINVGIEYDGEAWHQDPFRDHLKDVLCEENNVLMIHIREPGCPNNDSFKNAIVTSKPYADCRHLNRPIKQLIEFINQKFNYNFSCDVDCQRDIFKIDAMIQLQDRSNSLAAKYPDLATQFDMEKNSPLTPDNISAGSNQKIWWICPKGHSYNATVNHRVIAARNGQTGCPICKNSGASIYQDGKYIGEHSLQKERPDISKYLDAEKSGDTADNISVSSSRKVWWKCSECGSEYQSTVSNRIKSSCPTLCPKCARKFESQKCHETMLQKRGSLAKNYPELLKEWDYAKNSDDPNNVACNANKKYWWKCSKCGYEWQAIPSARAVNHTGCPMCAKDKQIVTRRTTEVKKSGSLLEGFPELCKEWDYTKNDINPSDITFGSHYNAWWKCSKCGFEYRTVVKERTKKKRPTGCPQCKSDNLRKQHQKPIVRISGDGSKKFYASAEEACSELGLQKRNSKDINAACRQNTFSHGYHWRYIHD